MYLSGFNIAINTIMGKIQFAAILILLILQASVVTSQPVHIGVFAGTAAYKGDINDKLFPEIKQLKTAFGISANYEVSEKLFIRAGAFVAKVSGADSLASSSYLKLRNLSFQSTITELSFLGEWYLFNLYERSYSPYLFVGFSVFHFNPLTYGSNGQMVFLQPLSTEGQGLPGYASKPYKLTQLAIPFGGGLKFAFNDDFRIGIEICIRKLFTDYLDDVSTDYADPADLLSAKGALSVAFSYRGDEVAGGSPAYPAKGTQRGSKKYKDLYYTAGLHFTYRMGGNNSNNGIFGGNKRKMGCPGNPQ